MRMKKWKIEFYANDKFIASNVCEAPNPVRALRQALDAHKITCTKLGAFIKRQTITSYFIQEIKNEKTV